MALSEVERLRRSIGIFAEALEEKDQRIAELESAEPHIRFLLDEMDEHMEQVEANKKVMTERELERLRAYTALRKVYPREEGMDSEQKQD